MPSCGVTCCTKYLHFEVLQARYRRTHNLVFDYTLILIDFIDFSQFQHTMSTQEKAYSNLNEVRPPKDLSAMNHFCLWSQRDAKVHMPHLSNIPAAMITRNSKSSQQCPPSSDRYNLTPSWSQYLSTINHHGFRSSKLWGTCTTKMK